MVDSNRACEHLFAFYFIPLIFSERASEQFEQTSGICISHGLAGTRGCKIQEHRITEKSQDAEKWERFPSVMWIDRWNEKKKEASKEGYQNQIQDCSSTSHSLFSFHSKSNPPLSLSLGIPFAPTKSSLCSIYAFL